MLINNWLKSTTTLAAAAVFVAAGVQPASAQEVLLKSSDGTISVNGQLQSFEDGHYTIQTVLGSMRIAALNIICEGEACPDLSSGVEDVVVAGSDTLGDGLMPLLISGFAAQNGGITESVEQSGAISVTNLVGEGGFGDPIGTFSVSSTSSADAFAALQDKNTQIGMSSRRILPAEARRLRDVGGGNMIDLRQEHVVAVDSLSVVVNHQNPIGTISLADVDRIYSGLVTNWSELGGPNQPITVFGRASDTGSRAVFDSRIFSESGRSVSDAVVEKATDQEIAAAVNADPYAIGYVGFANVRGTKPVNVAGNCGISSHPDSFSSKTEEYPLQRRLYLYNRGDNLTDTAQNFIDYATSENADGVVAKSGFINLGVERVTQDTSNDRMQLLIENTTDPFEFGLMRDLLVDMFRWDRLSTTFRFASGSNQLDGKAILDLERLVTYLKQHPEGTEVSFVGFTDSDGVFEANRNLSIARAQQVSATVQELVATQLPGVTFSFKGFGELAPTSCNDTLEGKRINRRVEVWIRKPV